MKRFSVPADNELYHEFDTMIPHGVKAALIRGLIRIALQTPAEVMWKISTNENKPELFEIKVKGNGEANKEIT